VCNGTGASRAFTKIEFNLQAPTATITTANDFYDVSLVDGFNVSASFQPVGGTNVDASSQCSSDAQCQTVTGQHCTVVNGVGTCSCAGGEAGDCPSPYLCDATNGQAGMCSIDPYSCGTPGRFGKPASRNFVPTWPAVATQASYWGLQLSCPSDLAYWQPALNSNGQEVPCASNSDCSSLPGTQCQLAVDRLNGGPMATPYCSTLAGCMSTNNICSNGQNYQGTNYYTLLGCLNSQIPIALTPCNSDVDCPLEMDAKTHMSCVTTNGKKHCAQQCTDTTNSTDCPATMSCVKKTNGNLCMFGATYSAQYNQLYAATAYNAFSCYSSPASSVQCQGCNKWSDFGSQASYPGNPLPLATAACFGTSPSFFIPGGTGKSYSDYATPFKSACPSCYSTQFDDKTSTFVCVQPPQYVLTLCPDNILN
jgi:hypothetical protein